MKTGKNKREFTKLSQKYTKRDFFVMSTRTIFFEDHNPREKKGNFYFYL